jgi:beta-1,4-mannosyl-glycoprotein beta-1,4-N-acetylglucosaminyltransferase
MLGRFFKLCVICVLSLSSALWGQVYDCFMFFNEYDILDIRFHELYDHVDKFVIVESCEGFAGHSKPFRFENAKERYAQFLDKVIYVKLHERQQTESPWIREHWQRDQIMRGLVNCDPDDVIFISDCDEIIEANVIKETVEDLKRHKLVVFKPKQWSQYYLNRIVSSPQNLAEGYELELKKVQWFIEHPNQRGPGITGHTVAINYRDLIPYSPDKIRYNGRIIMPDNTQYEYPYFVTCYKVSGWHFSFTGGHEAVRNKCNNWAHAGDDIGAQYVGKDINQYDYELWRSKVDALILESVDESYPKYVRDNIEYFMSIGLIEPWQ